MGTEYNEIDLFSVERLSIGFKPRTDWLKLMIGSFEQGLQGFVWDKDIGIISKQYKIEYFEVFDKSLT